MSTESDLQIQRDLGRIEGKLDACLYEFRASNKAQDKVIVDHSLRITGLEKWRTGIVAGFVVLSGIAGLVWKVLPLLAQ